MTFGNSDGDKRSYRVRFDKIHSNLPGFRCETTPRQGAKELLELFQTIQPTRERFEFRAFTRLKQLEHLLRTDQIFWKRRNGDLDDQSQPAHVL